VPTITAKEATPTSLIECEKLTYPKDGGKITSLTYITNVIGLYGKCAKRHDGLIEFVK